MRKKTIDKIKLYQTAPFHSKNSSPTQQKNLLQQYLVAAKVCLKRSIVVEVMEMTLLARWDKMRRKNCGS